MDRAKEFQILLAKWQEYITLIPAVIKKNIKVLLHQQHTDSTIMNRLPLRAVLLMVPVPGLMQHTEKFIMVLITIMFTGNQIMLRH